jgi:hypothetical protein
MSPCRCGELEIVETDITALERQPTALTDQDSRGQSGRSADTLYRLAIFTTSVIRMSCFRIRSGKRVPICLHPELHVTCASPRCQLFSAF